MPAPVPVTRTWTIDPNNRIVYTSLVQTTRDLLFGWKEFLKANGYVVIGSSNGVTATPTGLISPGNDSIDRWVTAADAGIRGTVAAAPQSWVVLRDGNGVDTLFTYQGAGVSPTGNDIFRMSFSPGNLFTSAATPTHQPTASDEQLMWNASVIGTGASDRIWHGWASSDAKAFRFALCSTSLVTGVWGVEDIVSCVEAPAIFDPPVVGFGYNRTGLLNFFSTYSANTRAGVARVMVASTPLNVTLGGGNETALGATSLVISFTGRTELQGGTYYNTSPLSWWSTVANAQGKLGNRIDWYVGGADDGRTYNSRLVLNLAGTIWPWDGVTVPMIL